MAFRRSESAHQALIAVLAKFLVSQGYRNVKADLPGYDCPEEIRWRGTNIVHIPDASGWRDGKLHIFEVETEDTISIEHTKSQLELFNAFARQNNARLTVMVPRGVEEQARQQYRAWGLSATVW